MWKCYDRDGTGWDEFYGVAEDAEGRPWLEDRYFGVLEGTIWLGFPDAEFRAVGPPVVDSRGDLWIPSYDGLYRWQPTALELSSMPDRRVRSP